MKKITLYTLFFFLAFQLQAKDPVNDFINDPLLKDANVSLLIKDVSSGQTLYEYCAANGRIPASTMKVITTATALEILGENFRFETKLQTDNEVTADGVLNGNLYILGGGDPTLGSSFIGNRDFLKQWVNAIKKAGIKTINGSIIADESIFDYEGINTRWLWEDIGNYYAPGIYGISYMDNTLRVYMQAGEPGTTPTIIKTEPQIPGLVFENHLRTVKNVSDSIYFHGAPRSNIRTIYGEVAPNRASFVSKADIPNPGLLLAQHLHNLLLENGINVAFPPSDQSTNKKERKTIHTHYSPELSSIIKETNFTSNNHYAEHIFRYLALQDNKIATNNGAVGVIRNFWKSKGLPVEQLFMYDGSGLSPTNAISPEFMVGLLIYMKKESANSTVFYNSLPVSGETGTMAWILKNTNLQGKVHAKSGSINRVRCYAGYIESNGKTYAFSVMANNYNTSKPRTVVKKIEQFLLSAMQE